MNLRYFMLGFILVAAPAYAQSAQPFSPPDAELWSAMAKAISDVPMSLTAHQQIQQLLQNVQTEARTRELRAQAMKPKEDVK